MPAGYVHTLLQDEEATEPQLFMHQITLADVSFLC